MNKDLKIVFMGTPDFASTVLSYIAESGAEIGYAVSQPDKAKNRGRKILSTPVKEKAEGLGIEVLQPEKIKGNEGFIKKIKDYAPDLIVVAAYGKILPKSILDIPRLGCVNVHASLLPEYRGAAPVQRAIINGDEKTGVTLMYMEEGLDTGDMIAKAFTDTAGKTAGELMDELAHIGGRLLCEKLDDIASGRAEREAQDDSASTYAPMIFREDGKIDFSRSPEEIERLIRGLSPQPGAYTYLEGGMFKIWRAEPVDEDTCEPYGTVVSLSKKGIDIAAGGRILRALEVQAPGKKRMAAGDYIRGSRLIAEGTRLGE